MGRKTRIYSTKLNSTNKHSNGSQSRNRFCWVILLLKIRLAGKVSNLANDNTTEKCAKCGYKQTVKKKLEFYQCYNCKLVNPT